MEIAITPVVVAALTAAASILVGTLAALANYFATRRDRRRLLYGDAYKTALAWREMLYRVRRRDSDGERDLINQFHELQDRLLYFEGWISSESPYMARSYQRLVASVKRVTEPLIRQAWESPTRQVPGNAQEGDVHPDVSVAADLFMRDVRSHLSPWKWRKVAVWWRNPAASTPPSTPPSPDKAPSSPARTTGDNRGSAKGP